MAKQSIQIEVPEGYEATGEVRKPSVAEWYLESGIAYKACGFIRAERIILRPVAPNFKVGDYVVNVMSKRVWLLTQRSGCTNCVASDGATGLIANERHSEFFELWHPSLNTPVGHREKSIELGPVDQIDGERYKVIGRWFTLDELCPVEFCKHRFPIMVESTRSDAACIVYDGHTVAGTFKWVDGSADTPGLALGWHYSAADIIDGKRSILTESEALARVKPTLLPCPFCGGEGKKECDSDWLYWIRCKACGATCNEAKDEADAIRLWNTRGGGK